MTKRERIAATLGRKPVDRPPVSFWRHAPAVDHTARGLADAMLAFHRRWELDFIKVTSSGVYFDDLAGLPVHGINWHDRLTEPTLAGAAGRFGGAVFGGLDEGGLLRRGPAAAIAAQIEDAVNQTGGAGLCVTSGCGLPLDVPDAHLDAVVAAVRESSR